ncbi:Major facilitator superfamily domain general substrate transporter [Penicillium angulare]|uniref:Major facilitator superfamily domain general substrate transporter n=1 Tax=Penicillium angulare TaxID=116970 RepID=UPI002541C1DD|nr:Major facilitator superfamily domain general substrate transporter [Penicillium angulare]KAJ5266454.1 Major facilitator superfamily domain general substrate transporter [Penicillium angulare]
MEIDSAEDSPPDRSRENEKPPPKTVPRWKKLLGGGSSSGREEAQESTYRPTSTMGILSDRFTDEVPGTVLLLSSDRNEPLGMRHQPQRMSTSSLPISNTPSRSSSRNPAPQRKRTANGEIVLDPQPDDSVNDPLNWPVWQRDTALVSLGFYCLIGGGMTTVLAAGFSNVAATYHVTEQQVAFTTGLYMMGLGLGSVVMSPTAILYGKRPVYLLGATLFIISGIWRPHAHRTVSDLMANPFRGRRLNIQPQDTSTVSQEALDTLSPISKKHKSAHVGFANDVVEKEEPKLQDNQRTPSQGEESSIQNPVQPEPSKLETRASGAESSHIQPPSHSPNDLEASHRTAASPSRSVSLEPGASLTSTLQYTNRLRDRPKVPYPNLLKVWNGRIARDNWFKIALRPFVLYAYPSVLWSAVVYALSVGWLIVISESVSKIFESKETYGFTALQAGLVYISPFLGGLLGTAVAGKVSDIVVRFMTRRNGGIYEPEFRLVMAIPIALSTTIGLMGFGWSAQLMDAWIVPTIFFGLISFGCCLGSTTAITFCVDSYRQYAGEALVTLNFSKNVLHGLVFSLFIVDWLETDGSRTVYLVIGGIQLLCLLMTIPMYMYGKRARMWTVRKQLMERF